MLPPGSLDLTQRYSLNDNVAKSTVEQLLGESLEGDGRAFITATAQILTATEKHSCRETVGRPGVA